MNYIDLIILGLLALSIIAGLMRGFVSEVVSLIALIAAFVVASLYANPMAIYFAKNQSSAPVSHVAIGVCFTILFLVVLLLGALVRRLLNSVVKVVMLSAANRILGGLFGFLRGCLYIVAGIFLVQLSPMAEDPVWKDTQMVAVFQPLTVWVSEQANPLIHSQALPERMLDR